MFNHEADESVACDESYNNEQDHHYCMFVSLHICTLTIRLWNKFYISESCCVA